MGRAQRSSDDDGDCGGRRIRRIQVTRRLVDAGVEVTLLEAGGEDTNPAIHDPTPMGELWHGSPRSRSELARGCR